MAGDALKGDVNDATSMMQRRFLLENLHDVLHVCEIVRRK